MLKMLYILFFFPLHLAQSSCWGHDAGLGIVEKRPRVCRGLQSKETVSITVYLKTQFLLSTMFFFIYCDFNCLSSAGRCLKKKKKYIKALMHPSTPKRVLHIKQNGLGGSARNFSGEPLAPFEQWSESRARAWPHQTHLLPFPDSITELSNQHRAKRSSLSHHKLPLPTPWSINKYLNLTA